MPARQDPTAGVALGDVDGDGDLDLVLANAPSGFSEQNRLYLNDGSGTFTDATAGRLPLVNDWTSAVVLGDVEADGDLDIVFGNSRQNTLYLNDGSGFFNDATSWMPARLDSTAAAALGDVDGDGDLDLALATSFNNGQNRLDLNLLRHFDTPLLLRVGRAFALEVYARHSAATAGAFAIPMLASATANVPLPPFGTLSLAPSTTVALPLLSIPQPAGVATIPLAVPNVPNLAGVSLYGQALIAQPPALLRLTNFTADAIVR